MSEPSATRSSARLKTASALERDLMQKLGAKYLRSPQVTVFIREYQ
jgi:polysaccharide export outer membrane protein